MKFITILSTILSFNNVSAKPTNTVLDMAHWISTPQPSNIHKLIKRAPINGGLETGGLENLSKTGFAAVAITKDNENHKYSNKNRKCEKWGKEPHTNRPKCLKFVEKIASMDYFFDQFIKNAVAS